MPTTRHYIIAVLMLATLAASAVAPYSSSAYLVDRVEAVVNDELITWSDVERAVSEAARRRYVTDPAAKAALKDEVLSVLIERKLIVADARRFNIVDVSDAEVDAAVEAVMAGYDSKEEFLADLASEEITLDELKDDIRDQLLAYKYVDRRVRFFVRVTLDDVKKYYEDHIDSFGGRTFSEVHDEIHDLLVEIKTNEKLDQYIKELRERAEITIVGRDEMDSPTSPADN